MTSLKTKSIEGMKDYILTVLDIANDVIETTPHIKVSNTRDIRISTFAVAKLIIEADKQ